MHNLWEFQLSSHKMYIMQARFYVRHASNFAITVVSLTTLFVPHNHGSVRFEGVGVVERGHFAKSNLAFNASKSYSFVENVVQITLVRIAWKVRCMKDCVKKLIIKKNHVQMDGLDGKVLQLLFKAKMKLVIPSLNIDRNRQELASR